MQITSPLSAEWHAWIDENLARSCTPESMIDAMVAGDIAPLLARSAVYSAAYAHASGGGPAYRPEPPRVQTAGNHIDIDGQRIRIAVRLNAPCVIVFDNVLSEAECDGLIALAREKVRRSTVVNDDDATSEGVVHAARTSANTFLANGHDPLLDRVNARLATLMGQPATHAEPLQVLRYQPGEEYQPHFDYFAADTAGASRHLKHGGQRVSTLVLYLTDVEAGGETVFPEAGLSVTPRKGSGVYFEYANSTGQLDPRTLHGGAPVLRGEKWAATKWFRQGPFGSAANAAEVSKSPAAPADGA